MTDVTQTFESQRAEALRCGACGQLSACADTDCDRPYLVSAQADTGRPRPRANGFNRLTLSSRFRWLGRGGFLFAVLLTAGCGNQMLRQPAFTPLDTPRGAPPSDSVPVNMAQTPFDGKAVNSPAYGDALAAPVVKNLASFPNNEPNLPPPNLSDNARYEPAPAAVDALRSPLPNDPRIVQAGHILFLNRCIQCHNPGGYGYGVVGGYLVPHPPDLAGPLVQHISNGAMFWHITMGQGKMPGFRHWTTPQERWSLVAYVRSLKGVRPDPNRDNAAAWTEASTAPYPVYGVDGFEQGKSAYPFKVINPEGGEGTSQPRVTNRGFGQPPPRAQSQP